MNDYELKALVARLRAEAALRGWQKWWESPWDAKRPDVARKRYNAGRAVLAQIKGTGSSAPGSQKSDLL